MTSTGGKAGGRGPPTHFAILGGLLPIKPRAAARDAFAGLTLASMNIPQVLGYTRIAGTPIVTGLYTVLLPLVAFAVFGSSRHLVVAADSATAAIFSGSLSRMATLASEKYMALVGMLTLLTAGLLLLARIFKLGFLADFLSRTALVGFLTGVGIQVGIAMLGGMLGVDVVSHHTLGQLWEIVRGAPTLDPRVMGLSIFVVASILIGHRFAPRLPVSLIVVVGMIAVSAWLHFAAHGFAVIGPVPGGLPVVQMAGRDLERNAGAHAGRRVMLRHDHRPERGDLARLCGEARRAGRRERGHSGTGRRQRRSGGQRGLRRQRQPDPDGDGGTGGRAKPGRAARFRRRRARRAAVPDRPAAVSAALRSGEHRFHHRRRHGRRARPCAPSAAKAGANFFWRCSPPPRCRRSASSRASCWRSRSRSSATSATATGRTRWCWCPCGAAGSRRRPSPGAETDPGLIVYRFGADLFYANADRFADEVRALVDSAPDAGPVVRRRCERSHSTSTIPPPAPCATSSTNLAAKKVNVVLGAR